MRGIDYRCERATIALVIAKTFSCTVEALQGMARVGRFKDQCKRIRFQNVAMVDTQQELATTAKLFKYMAQLQKSIKIKAAVVNAPQRTVGNPQPG